MTNTDQAIKIKFIIEKGFLKSKKIKFKLKNFLNQIARMKCPCKIQKGWN
jgi:hypothetical protein